VRINSLRVTIESDLTSQRYPRV